MLSLAKSDPDMPDDQVTPDYMLENLCIIGTPEECVRQLHQVYDQTGGFGTLLMIAHDWDDKAKWLRSMELLATSVLPELP
jgi:limonene 1,2-monooxygenase